MFVSHLPPWAALYNHPFPVYEPNKALCIGRRANTHETGGKNPIRLIFYSACVRGGTELHVRAGAYDGKLRRDLFDFFPSLNFIPFMGSFFIVCVLGASTAILVGALE